MEVNTDPKGIGVTTTKMEVAGSTNKKTVRGTVTGIQVTVTDRGMAGVNIGETVSRDPGHRGGGLGPGMVTTGGGGGLRKGYGMMATLISDDGQITEQSS